jgi:hypothetical protein
MILKHRGSSAYHLHVILGQGQAGLLMVCIVNLQSARKFKPVKIMHKKESFNKLVCWRQWQILVSHDNLFYPDFHTFKTLLLVAFSFWAGCQSVRENR